LYGAFLVLYIF